MTMRESFQGLLGRRKVQSTYPWQEDYGTYFGRVTRIHPESCSVDVTILDGGRYTNVPVMMPLASSNAGLMMLLASDLAQDGEEESYARADGEYQAEKRDVYAVLTFVRGERRSPLCIGFAYPEVTQMNFNNPDTGEADKLTNPAIFRIHGIYFLIKDDGTFEVRLKDGTTLISSATDTPTDLDGKDFDKVWKTDTPDDPRFLNIQHPSGTELTVTPDGTVTVKVADAAEKIKFICENIFAGTDEATNDKLITKNWGINKFNLHKHSGGGNPPQAQYHVVEDLPDTTEKFKAD